MIDVPNTPQHPTADVSRGGFSLVEILVALVIVGIMTVLLGQVMQSVMRGSADLRQRFINADSSVIARQLIHRDLQTLTSADTMLVEENGLQFVTTHAQLQDEPVPVKVIWVREGNRLVRVEKAPGLNYASRLELVDGVSRLQFEVLRLGEEAWTSAAAGFRGGQDNITGIRIVLGFEEGGAMTMVERIPHGLAGYGR